MGVSHLDGHYSVLLKLIIIIGCHHVQEAPIKEEPKSPAQKIMRRRKAYSAVNGTSIGEVGGGSRWRPNLHQPAPWQASANGCWIVKIRRCCDSKDHKEVHSEHKGITEGGHGGDVSKAQARACSGSKNLRWNGLPDGVSVLVGFFRTVVIIMSFARNRTSPHLLVWNIIHLHDLLYCE